MEPRVVSGGTPYPKEGHRILGLWVGPDAYSRGTCRSVTGPLGLLSSLRNILTDTNNIICALAEP